MAYYLVRAKPNPERRAELHTRLGENAFMALRPFGKALTHSLNEARTQPDADRYMGRRGLLLAAASPRACCVLDRYFDEIKVEQVNAGEGLNRIERLPKLNAKG
jgi:hypothetical protein